MSPDRINAAGRSSRPRRGAGLLATTLALGGCAGVPPGAEVRGGYAKGEAVAVLLPGPGPAGEVARAVREGLRAAYGADDTQAKPGLRYIDTDQPVPEPESEPVAEAEGTGEVPTAEPPDPAGQVVKTYKEAVGAGATRVIGPLLKPEVDALARGPALAVPTLALNVASVPGQGAPNLYQLALDPESESVDLARKARAMGFSRALALVPAGEAGARRADPFRRQWQRQGGSLVGEVALGPADDPAAAVTALLGEGPGQFVFLAGDADLALRVYPILRVRAPALPVIATSAVYSGSADPARDAALHGLLFVDAPWILGLGPKDDPVARSRFGQGAANPATTLGLRLYALGIDAYRLAPRLPELARSPGSTFAGKTGTLSVDTQGRVQRELTLARFGAEGPRPIDPKTIAQEVMVSAPPTPPAPAVAAVSAPLQPPQSRSPAKPVLPVAPVGPPKALAGPPAGAPARPVVEPPRPAVVAAVPIPTPPPARPDVAAPAKAVPEPSRFPVRAPSENPVGALQTMAARPASWPAQSFEGARARDEGPLIPSSPRPAPGARDPFQGARARDE